MNLTEFSKDVHKNAVDHGWWENDRGFGEVIALCHSELSEALEEYRAGGLPNEIYYAENMCKECGGLCVPDAADECPCNPEECGACKKGKPEGIAVELADCMIRILDWCGKENIDIERIIKQKHEYNKTRPYKHGGKLI